MLAAHMLCKLLGEKPGIIPLQVCRNWINVAQASTRSGQVLMG